MAYILGVLYLLFYRTIWINSCLGMMNLIAIFSFCTHLTFDLILRLGRISRLGIHPNGFWHTSRNTISMDATFYPSEDFFHGMDCQLIASCRLHLNISQNNAILYKPLPLFIFNSNESVVSRKCSMKIRIFTLSDNSLNMFPDNKQTDFTVRLHHPIHIEEERWEVALVEFATPSEVLNITEENNIFFLTFLDLRILGRIGMENITEMCSNDIDCNKYKLFIPTGNYVSPKY